MPELEKIDIMVPTYGKHELIIVSDRPCRGYEIYWDDGTTVAYSSDNSHHGTPIKRLFIPDKLMRFLKEAK